MCEVKYDAVKYFNHIDLKQRGSRLSICFGGNGFSVAVFDDSAWNANHGDSRWYICNNDGASTDDRMCANADVIYN